LPFVVIGPLYRASTQRKQSVRVLRHGLTLTYFRNCFGAGSPP
jgi:hypothetical protein